MNDPWDVKSVRQSNQYLSCMKINGVPLLPPVLSKECRKEMQYYKLLAREVEKRIQTLKPFIVEIDSDSSEDKTDAPELPESEQSFEIPIENNKNVIDVNNGKITPRTTDNCLDDSAGKIFPASNTYDNISTNFTPDDSASSKLSSKLVIDLSLSINETGKSLLDSVNSSQTALNDIPERDYDCLKSDQKEILSDGENAANKSNLKDDKLSFHLSINKDTVSDPITLQFSQEGPSSLSSKSFTGSLNDIHTDSVRESPMPLTRQRSYTVLKPSPMLLAHLQVQSINTGIDVASISMSESMSSLSCNRKRRSWDLESAKVKWSSMALELKKKNITNGKNAHSANNSVTRPTVRKAHSTPPKTKSLIHDKIKRSPPKSLLKSDPIQKPKKAMSPVRNTTALNSSKTPTADSNNHRKEDDLGNKKLISESDDPATRVRELYEKIQKQQLIQMANLVEKQKKEQMLLQQVFEEQNNLLFTQLKTICPKSPNEVKEAWVEKTREAIDRGPVSLSQLINDKTEQNYDNPVLSTLTETSDYINYCDNVLKKSRDLTGSMKKKQPKKSSQQNEKIPSPKPEADGSRTRTHSPVRKTTPTSRKLTYENSASSDRDYDPILTDRTNDTMADLNVTFPSDHSEESQPFIHNSMCEPAAIESPIPFSAASCRSTDKAIRSMEETIQNSINSMCVRTPKPNVFRIPTTQERVAATKLVAHAKGYLVRRLMRTERVQATVQTIKDALLCALQLHQDREGIRGADVDLHRRLIQQITAACYSLHDTFVASSPAERCATIAADRSRRKSLAARVSPALPAHATRHYRPTDLMSQSHSGVFPARNKRPAPSIMSQSNYETYSSDKSLMRRYMPSPRRRPWR